MADPKLEQIGDYFRKKRQEEKDTQKKRSEDAMSELENIGDYFRSRGINEKSMDEEIKRINEAKALKNYKLKKVSPKIEEDDDMTIEDVARKQKMKSSIDKLKEEKAAKDKKSWSGFGEIKTMDEPEMDKMAEEEKKKKKGIDWEGMSDAMIKTLLKGTVK